MLNLITMGSLLSTPFIYACFLQMIMTRHLHHKVRYVRQFVVNSVYLYFYFTDDHDKTPSPQGEMYGQLLNVIVST